MVVLMYMMVAVILLVVVFSAYVLIKRKDSLTTAERYNVFEIYDNKMTVLVGIPVVYDVDTIERVTFSAFKARRSFSYTGVMRIVKKNGGKSRPFLFDSSVMKKKVALASSREEIEEATRYLMSELNSRGIQCTFLSN